jgi:hypothetical protein
MTLFSISPIQLLNVWDDLYSAMLDNNSYGGDVAEIYLFPIMSPGPMRFSDTSIEERKAVSSNLHAIFRLFEQRHNAIVEFENGENIDTLLTTGINTHRIHIRVNTPA